MSWTSSVVITSCTTPVICFLLNQPRLYMNICTVRNIVRYQYHVWDMFIYLWISMFQRSNVVAVAAFTSILKSFKRRELYPCPHPYCLDKSFPVPSGRIATPGRQGRTASCTRVSISDKTHWTVPSPPHTTTFKSGMEAKVLNVLAAPYGYAQQRYATSREREREREREKETK